jgi:hypothetical protein
MIQIIHSLQAGPTSTIGKSVEMVMAFILGFICLLLLGIIYSITIDRLEISWVIKGLIMGLTLTIVIIPLVNIIDLLRSGDFPKSVWLLSINLIWGFSLCWGVKKTSTALNRDTDLGRKRSLVQIGFVSLTVSLLAIGLDRLLQSERSKSTTEVVSDLEIKLDPTPSPKPTTPGFSPVEGTRPEITPMDEFYRVDINLLPPGQEDYARNADAFTKRLLAQGGETDLPTESYVLIVDGLVETPLALDIDTIKSYPQIEHYATLSCVSNPVGGDLIGTTLFQGIQLQDILAQAGIKSETQKIKFTCVDGYTESLPVEVANDPSTLLCYSMGNQPLNENHGSPIRLYTPGRYGMKSPKWIIKIEAINDDYQGYWQQQGWSDEAIVKTTAVIDAIIPNKDGLSEVGGIAYAGHRGINSVELKVNDNKWIPAIVNRPLSQFTWVLWRAEVSIPATDTKISVRAIDGEGNPQIEEPSATHPDGASGYHSLTIKIDS